jgi:hypothetical protein
MVPWKLKANRIIARLCLEAYRAANAGKRKHVPYVVPGLAHELVRCLGRNDELGAKALFLTYEGLAAIA